MKETEAPLGAVVSLMTGLPDRLQGWWHTSSELTRYLELGGVDGISQDLVLRALHAASGVQAIERTRTSGVRWYLVGEKIAPGWSPSSQAKVLESRRHRKPKMIPNYYLANMNRFASDVGKVSSYVQSNPQCAEEGQENPRASKDDNNSTSTIDDRNETDATAAEETRLPGTCLPVGMKLIDEDMDEEWTHTVVAHTLHCKRTKLEVISREKKGFEVKVTYRCRGCSKVMVKRASRDVSSVDGKRRGVPVSEMNAEMSIALYAAAINPARAAELFAESGVHAPSESTLMEMREKVKQQVMNLSDAQLLANRRKHNAACRKLPNYKGDIKWTDSKGVKHSVARGPICTDGSGYTRAYNHHITGNQHSLIAFSLVTCKPIYVIHDQISCKKCSIELTKQLLDEDGHVNVGFDLASLNLSHDGICHRNSSHGPANAEEYACQRLGKLLLTGSEEDDAEALSDEDAVFVDEIITDGDTRGANKLIQSQVDIIGQTVEGVAEQIPDIGHAIKCISNGFYKEADTNSSVRGVGLLQPPRIKAISGDIRKHLKTLHAFVDAEEKRQLEGTPEFVARSNAKIKATAKRCLQDIYNIVPHHCGDHRKCSSSYCLFQKLKRHFEARKAATGEDWNQEMLLEKYAQRSRFKGKNLSISPAARKRLVNVISSRISTKNIMRLAKLMSSNLCENYFGVLAKYTQGKRLNMDQSDSWKVLEYFVAGLRSDSGFTSKVLKELGGSENEARKENLSILHARQKRRNERKKTEQHQNQRSASNFAKLNKMQSMAQQGGSHKTDKLKPTDDCKAKVKKGSKRKRNPEDVTCGNCGGKGHNKSECPEPQYKGREKKKKKSKKRGLDVDIADVHRMFGLL